MKAYWEATGCRTEGNIFPFSKFQHQSVSVFFKECYAEAGIPEKLWKGMPIHIWRHTACQDLLDATDRNWELVAEVLSWESIDTMKKHYGKACEDVITRGILKAMGIEVKEERKEFKF
jgi:integrase